MRSTSSRVLSSTVRAAGVRSSWRRLTSSSARIAASGVRSSCDVSATSRRCSATPAWMRSSMVLSVVARCATSSAVGGTSMRSPSASGPIPSALDVIRSIGASARRASHQPAAAASSRATGRAISSRVRTRCTERLTGSSEDAATTTRRCPPRVTTGCDQTRKSVPSSLAVLPWARIGRRATGSPNDAMTRPDGPRTCDAARSPDSTVPDVSRNSGTPSTRYPAAICRTAGRSDRSVASIRSERRRTMTNAPTATSTTASTATYHAVMRRRIGALMAPRPG